MRSGICNSYAHHTCLQKLFQRCSKNFLFSDFILHREIVLTMKTSITLRAYLMSEDTSIARLRSARGVYLSGGLKPATETGRKLTYPPHIEARFFPTEINIIFLKKISSITELLRLKLINKKMYKAVTCLYTKMKEEYKMKKSFQSHS